MRVTPRKEEVAAIVALLEDTDYDSASTLAKDIIKECADLFAKRDWYAWIWRENPEAFQFAFGPLSSESEASRLGKKVGLDGQTMILKLYSTAALLQKVGELPPSLFCSACEHPDHCHEIPKYNGRCWIKGCKCRKLDKSVVQRVQP